VLTYWAEDSTETVVAHLATVKGDARERLYALMEFVVVTGRTEYDYAIRAWALFDPKAATVVRAVDRRRLGYVNNLFREAGFSAAQATARSRLLADYLIWDEHLTVPESAAKRRRLLRTRWEILTKA
jgi:hypothetical protein